MTKGKQRGNSEGSVYEEGTRSPSGPTGRWIAQILIEGRKRRAIVDSEAKAKKKLREMQSQLDAANPQMNPPGGFLATSIGDSDWTFMASDQEISRVELRGIEPLTPSMPWTIWSFVEVR